MDVNGQSRPKRKIVLPDNARAMGKRKTVPSLDIAGSQQRQPRPVQRKPVVTTPPRPKPPVPAPVTLPSASALLKELPKSDHPPLKQEVVEIPSESTSQIYPTVPNTETPVILNEAAIAKKQSEDNQPGSALSKRKIIEISLVLVFLVGIVGGGHAFLAPSKSPIKATANTGSLSSSTLGIKDPSSNQKASVAGALPFTPIVPQDKPNLAKLGSTAYNSQYGSYSFDDTYLGSRVRVSEQKLPAGKTAEAMIDKISASLKPAALQQFTNPEGQPAYILNNTAKTGKQVVIFTTKDILFFVQSANEHDAATWLTYISSFK